MKKLKFLSWLFLLALAFSASAQVENTGKNGELDEAQLKRWSHLDLVADTVPGMSVDKAYRELLKGKKSTTVVVGVIDSGVDIEHEDLKSVVWTNPREIAGNGIDDDKNGYVDDVNGWNFLGDITKENYELDRIVHNPSLAEPAVYAKAKEQKDKKTKDAAPAKKHYEGMLNQLDRSQDVIAKKLGKTDYTKEEIAAIESTDPEIERSKAFLLQMFGYGMSMDELRKEILKEYEKNATLVADPTAFKDYRAEKLGDDPENLNARNYGNANVMGPDKEEILHGTHVAGIIAQTRGNNIGGDGIADNVKIMTLRAVPDGDEYDKDIALAIRYAVDNGAKVINGSFGKSFSPHKQWVYDAIKYAESKDVLIVHAAGNDAKDIDVEDNFPNDSDDKVNEFAGNVLTIGALNPEYGTMMVADFSNYGKNNVDIFSPGVKIYATTPNNTYQYLQGTSMASPNVAGVAALIREYYPKLTAKQVKEIIMASGTEVTFDVAVGGDPEKKKKLSDLSRTGRIVNAYNALVLADKVSKGKVKTIKG